MINAKRTLIAAGLACLLAGAPTFANEAHHGAKDGGMSMDMKDGKGMDMMHGKGMGKGMDHDAMHSQMHGKDKGDWDGGGDGDWGTGSGGGWESGEGGSMSGYRMRMVSMLDLTAEQRKQVRDIQRDNKHKQIDLNDKIGDLSDTLLDMYKQDKREAKEIGKVYGQIFDIRRQMIELSIDATNRVTDVLTKEQKEKMKMMTSKKPMGHMEN